MIHSAGACPTGIALLQVRAMYYLGCPAWAHAPWQGSLYAKNSRSADFLAQYCRFFNAVEGNTTFYANPALDTITRWLEQSTSDFRFNLKVPKAISHQQGGLQLLTQWLALISPLRARIGFVHLQLPQRFGPQQLLELSPLLELIRAQHACAVEIRHPAFFDKAEHEQALHQMLRFHQCERLSFDSRSLFAVPATTSALVDAQRKKPRLPVHAVALTTAPVFRFIGTDELEHNRPFYQPWLKKMLQWLAEGKTPYAFFHTPDNTLAPQLARQFAADLVQLGGPSHPILSPWPGELQQAAETQLTLFAD